MCAEVAVEDDLKVVKYSTRELSIFLHIFDGSGVRVRDAIVLDAPATADSRERMVGGQGREASTSREAPTERRETLTAHHRSRTMG
jgi:hypothetical protein